MTKETRLIVDIRDITRLRFQCRNPECEQEILYKLDKGSPLMESCPHCNQPWKVVKDPKEYKICKDERVFLPKLLKAIIEQDHLVGVRPKLEIEINEDLLKKSE